MSLRNIKKEGTIIPLLFYPKAQFNYTPAGFLTCSDETPSHPPTGGQWQKTFNILL